MPRKRRLEGDTASEDGGSNSKKRKTDVVSILCHPNCNSALLLQSTHDVCFIFSVRLKYAKSFMRPSEPIRLKVDLSVKRLYGHPKDVIKQTIMMLFRRPLIFPESNRRLNWKSMMILTR